MALQTGIMWTDLKTKRKCGSWGSKPIKWILNTSWPILKTYNPVILYTSCMTRFCRLGLILTYSPTIKYYVTIYFSCADGHRPYLLIEASSISVFFLLFPSLPVTSSLDPQVPPFSLLTLITGFSHLLANYIVEQVVPSITWCIYESVCWDNHILRNSI